MWHLQCIFFLLFQLSSLNYRRSLCETARNLDCDRELFDEPHEKDDYAET